MKVVIGSDGKLHAFLSSALDGCEWSALCSSYFTSWGKHSHYPIERQLVSPRDYLDVVVVRIICSCQDSNPCFPACGQSLCWMSCLSSYHCMYCDCMPIVSGFMRMKYACLHSNTSVIIAIRNQCLLGSSTLDTCCIAKMIAWELLNMYLHLNPSDCHMKGRCFVMIQCGFNSFFDSLIHLIFA